MQANLCFVDIDKQFVELPEETVQFPYKQDLAQEISENLIRYGVRMKDTNCGSPKPLNKNLNERGVRGLRYSNISGTSSLPRRKDKKSMWNYESDSGT